MVYLYVYLIIYSVYVGVRSGYVLNQYQHSVRGRVPINPVTKHGKIKIMLIFGLMCHDTQVSFKVRIT